MRIAFTDSLIIKAPVSVGLHQFNAHFNAHCRPCVSSLLTGAFFRWGICALLVVLPYLSIDVVASTATEDFSTDSKLDLAHSTAAWSAAEQKVVLAFRRAGLSYGLNEWDGTPVGSALNPTLSLASGDVNGDGHLDVIAGNNGQNKLYLNNGTGAPFDGVIASNVGSQTDTTRSLVLGDVDSDGDLDLVVGNSGQNKLYLNNGTAAPFDNVVPTGWGFENDDTYELALADVDNDDDLDVVAGNYNATNKLYLNDGTATPFNGVSGTSVGSETDDTFSLVLGDVNRDDYLDVIAGNYGQTNKLYLNNGTATPFNGVSGSDVGSDIDLTRGLALGDVNGDGRLDVLVGNDNGEASKLYLNGGDDTLFTSATAIVLGSDRDTTDRVALGDIDGDGDLDALIGNFGQNELYLNGGGATPFDGVIAIDVGEETDTTHSLTLADIDSDGDLDVLAGSFNQTNKLYLNNGLPFANVTALAVGAETDYTASLALGDVDGDGDLDVVAGNLGLHNKLYLNNGSATPFSGVTGTDVGLIQYDTYGLALGDFDGDGDLDVVAGNGGANKLYLNNGSATPFSGVAGTTVGAATDNTASLALGDVDGDGDLDVVAGNYGQINKLYLNNGSTTPFSGVTGTDVGSETDFTESLALGDVDGDGDLDVVAGVSGANKLYLNNGSTTPFSGVTGTTVGSSTDSTYSLALGDVDRDGDLDVVAGNYGRTNKLYLNNGSTTPFSGVTGTDVGLILDTTYGLALGDVDGDGDLDVVAGNYDQPNKLYLNNGSATPFSGVAGTTVGAATDNTAGLALGDVDGDGDLDVVAGNYMQINQLYLNNGTVARFTGWTGTDVGSDGDYTDSLAVGDLDGDGDLDVVAGNNGKINQLYLNNGTATPFANVTPSNVGSEANNTASLALGDIDGDGDLDIVVGNILSFNQLYLNDGTAAKPFENVTPCTFGLGNGYTYGLALGDLDGDGDLDVVAGNDRETNNLYLNNGNNPGDYLFCNAPSLSVGIEFDRTRSLALGDVDGDGDLDVVAGNQEENRLYRNNGTDSPFLNVLSSDVGTFSNLTAILALGDVDGDGDLDIVAGNTGGRNRLYLNNGNAASPFNNDDSSTVGSDIDRTYGLALGDVDGDGDLDVVAGNFEQSNKLYLNDGTATPFSSVTASDMGTELSATLSVALGDVDGNGDLNLMVANANQTNRLVYLGAVSSLTPAKMISKTVLDSRGATDKVLAAALNITYGMPKNTSIQLYVSNDGGQRWWQTRPGRLLSFQSIGNDVRWKAELRSQSPASAPELSALSLTLVRDYDGDGRPDECDSACESAGFVADTDDDNDGVADTADAFPFISLGGRTDTDGDGRPDDCDAACLATNMSADTDDDNDGYSDSDEIAEGTDPKDASDYPLQSGLPIWLLYEASQS